MRSNTFNGQLSRSNTFNANYPEASYIIIYQLIPKDVVVVVVVVDVVVVVLVLYHVPVVAPSVLHRFPVVVVVVVDIVAGVPW